MGTTVEDVANYFECRVSEPDLRVQINLEAIERLAIEVVEGFKKVPKRGLEVGGLLIGRVEQDCTVVDDFEALESEHRQGPSFLLSEKDKQALAGAVARCNAEPEKRVVGLYRSQTRAGLAPIEQDEALMRQHCPAAGAVLLLVKPEAGHRCTAALFAGGDVHGKPAEFPLHRGVLASGGYELVATKEPAAPVPRVEPAAPAPRLGRARLGDALIQQLELARQSRPPVEIAAARPRWYRKLAIAAGAGVVLCGGVAGYGASRWWRRTPAAIVTPPAPAAPALPPAARPLALGVTWSGNALMLRWDRGADGILHASRGELRITDGGKEHRLQLSAQELKEGSVAYWPSSKDVNLKLDVVTARGRTSESVRAVGIPLAEPPRSKPVQPAGQTSWAPYRARPSPDGHGFTRVSLHLVKAPAWNRLSGKAPITTPPRPLHHVLPSAPRALQQQVREPVAIDVKLSLDTGGKVRRWEVVRRVDTPKELATLALDASRRWSFAPARSGERRVASEVVLHYQFGDAAPAETRLP